MQQPWLWARIVEYEFPRGFDEKLCELFGCRAQTAEKLKEEYRRFVYLAVISPREATPSVQVDHVWHLHLSYTRDYWTRFCPQVLQREFHHDPCDGAESRPRYDEQYAATLALYEQEFGSLPPFKAWPTKNVSSSDWAGSALAFVGFVIACWAVLSGGPGHIGFLGTGLVMMFVGVVLTTLSTPYGQSARSFLSGGGSGGGGGSTGGCGGGCGGGGG